VLTRFGLTVVADTNRTSDTLSVAGGTVSLTFPVVKGGITMGLAMFSRLTDDGGTETVVAVNGQGHVIVNGQRMY
jgi:hypothetical protein